MTEKELAAPATLDAWVAQYGGRPVTWTLVVKMLDVLNDTIVDGVLSKNAALEARIAALEAKPSVKFCGVWSEGRTYAPGDAATQKGSLWICRAPTSGAPGVDFVGWVLAVKRGAA